MTTAVSEPRSMRQRALRWLYILLISYVGALVLLLLLENWLVYRPSGPNEWEPSPSSSIKDVEFTSAAGDKIHGWWNPHPGSTGALLYFHGNAGNLSWRAGNMAMLRHQLGVSVLIIDYPGYGKSSGSPSEAGCYAAADAAYDWLTKTQGIAGEKIGLYGGSLGGGVAVDLASRKPHRALVLIKTFTSVPDVGQNTLPWFPVRWLMRNRFDSLSKITLCKQPIFIAHGDADHIVPFSLGQRLFDAATSKKMFFRLPGADHNDPLPLECFLAIKDFLAQAAPLPAPAAN